MYKQGLLGKVGVGCCNGKIEGFGIGVNETLGVLD
jgi:hypothetical protein